MRVVVGDGRLGPDQTGVLGLAPAIFGEMHPRTVSRRAGPNPPAVTFDDRQLGRTFKTPSQSVGGLRVGGAARGQFAADVMHDPLTADFHGREKNQCLGAEWL